MTQAEELRFRAPEQGRRVDLQKKAHEDTGRPRSELTALATTKSKNYRQELAERHSLRLRGRRNVVASTSKCLRGQKSLV